MPNHESYKLEIKHDPNNSLWYVWIGTNRVSTGYKYQQSAIYFAEGFEQGWTLCRQAAVVRSQGLGAVVR